MPRFGVSAPLKTVFSQRRTLTVGVAEFKARCLELLADVDKRGDRIIVTKRGKPIARIEPAQPEKREVRGMYAGRARIIGDIVNVNFADEWESNR
jgi:prevent-host-death family protein